MTFQDRLQTNCRRDHLCQFFPQSFGLVWRYLAIIENLIYLAHEVSEFCTCPGYCLGEVRRPRIWKRDACMAEFGCHGIKNVVMTGYRLHLDCLFQIKPVSWIILIQLSL